MTINSLNGLLEETSNLEGELEGSKEITATVYIGHTHPNKSILDSILSLPVNDKYFYHEQSIPSDIWTITHNLNKHPAVIVVDSADNVVIGDVTYLSLNAVKIIFIGAFSGKAYLN
jgi:hypothetical protein